MFARYPSARLLALRTAVALGATMVAVGVAAGGGSAARADEGTGPADASSQQAPAFIAHEIELANVTEPSSDVQWGRAQTVLESRTESVLAVLTDYGSYAGIFPYFETSKVLSQRGSDAIVYLEAKVLNGAAVLWSQVRMRAQHQGPTQVFEARMMSGKGNIAQLRARWEITPLDNGQRTQVAFQILVDPDLPIPDGLISSELRKGAGQAMRALRRRVVDRETLATRATGTL